MIVDWRRRAVLAAPALLSVRAARAQSAWAPTAVMRIVVPYAPGGPLDALARFLAERLAPRLGQPVLVENRAGGAGVIGVDAVAKSPPDGLTLLATAMETQINNAVLLRGLPYDPLRDFTWIARPVSSTALLVGAGGLRAATLAEFTALTRSRRDLAYGSWGQGGMGHLMTAVLDRRLGWGLPHTPYRGAAPLLTDLLAGTVALGLVGAAAAQQHLSRGALVAYGVNGPARSPLLPDVPALAELVPEEPVLRLPIWYALLGPAGVAAPVVERLQRELATVLAAPDANAWLRAAGLEPRAEPPGAFAADFPREFAQVAELIRGLGLGPA